MIPQPSTESPSGVDDARRRGFKPRRGFSLIELLICMAVLLILVGIMLPALSRTVRNAQLVQCSSNLRTMYTSVQLYLADSNDFLPVADVQPWLDRLFPPLYETLEDYGGADRRIWDCPSDPREYRADHFPASYMYPPAFRMVNPGNLRNPNRIRLDHLPSTYAIFADRFAFHVPNPDLALLAMDHRNDDGKGDGGGGDDDDDDGHQWMGRDPRFRAGQNRILVNNKVTMNSR